MSLSLKDLKNTAFGGFEKESVLRYLRQVAQEHDEEMQALQKELETLRGAQANPGAAPQQAAPVQAVPPAQADSPQEVPAREAPPQEAQPQRPSLIQFVQPQRPDLSQSAQQQAVAAQSQAVNQVSQIADALQKNAKTLDALTLENNRLLAEVDGYRRREREIREGEEKVRIEAEQMITQAKLECRQLRFNTDKEIKELLDSMTEKMARMSRLSKEFEELCAKGRDMIQQNG